MLRVAKPIDGKHRSNGVSCAVCGYCDTSRKPRAIHLCVHRPTICGPGCQLRRTLAWWRVRDDGSCGCHQYAAQMDADGPDGCEARIDSIVAHLVEQAEKRGVILGAIAAASATTLVRRAIDAARAEAAAATPPPG